VAKLWSLQAEPQLTALPAQVKDLPSSMKAAKNLFTLSAFLCEREESSLAQLQAAAAVNTKLKESSGRRVCENDPACCGQQPSPARHTGQTCLGKPRVAPRADGKDALMTAKGTIPVSIPSPVIFPQGTGRWQGSQRR